MTNIFEINNRVLIRFRDVNKSITKAIVPDGVVAIGENAFKDCSHIKEIIIPDSVTSIRNGAFSSCKNLHKICLSSNLYSIGENAFYECAFTNIELPKSLSQIGKYAFYCCGLNEIEVPNGITKIPDSAFANCKKLSKVVLPNSIQEIGCGAFMNCEELVDINIPNKVKEIQSCTFKNCTLLFEIDLPTNLRIIRKDAFAYCNNLTIIEIPKSVINIEDGAFVGCINTDLSKPQITNSAPSTPNKPNSFVSLATDKPNGKNSISANINKPISKTWKIKYYLDEFDEPTDNAYIFGSLVGTRRCDRDNTILSPEVKIFTFIEKKAKGYYLEFRFLWHDTIQKIMSEKYVKLRIKDYNGNISEFILNVNKDNNSVWTIISDKLKAQLLSSNSTMLIIDEPEDHYFVTIHYLFKYQEDGLTNFLSHI